MTPDLDPHTLLHVYGELLDKYSSAVDRASKTNAVADMNRANGVRDAAQHIRKLLNKTKEVSS